MPFGLLSKVGKGIFGGIKKIPKILGDDGEEGGGEMALTPGFNPEARMPQIVRPRAGGVREMLFGQGQDDTGGGPINRPSPLAPNAVMDRPSPLALPPNIRPKPDDPITPGPNSPAFRKKTPYEEVQDARTTYNQAYKPPESFGARLKGGIFPAIMGALEGYGQTGDAGGAIGGALGGFGMGTLAPQQVYESQFDQRIKPRILERQKAEEEAAVKARALEDRSRDWQVKQAGMNKPMEVDGSLVSPQGKVIYQGQSKAPRQPRAPVAGNAPALYDPNTGQWIQNPYYKEKEEPYGQRYRDELDNVTEEWGDPRDVATSSTDARRESIIDSLPDNYKAILRTGKTLKGYTPDGSELTAAQNAFSQARQRDIDQGTRIDTDKRKTEARKRVRGGKGTASPRPTGKPGRTARSLQEAAELLKK